MSRNRLVGATLAGVLGWTLVSTVSAQEATPPEAPAAAAPPVAEAPTAPAAPEAAEPPAADAPAAAETTSREPIRLRGPAEIGPIGLDRVWSADPGADKTFRLRVGLGWFTADDFPRDGFESSFTRTDFSLAYTPIRYLETFLAVRSTSNTNEGSRPSLIQTQGDLTLGLKGGVFVTDTIAVGAATAVHLLSGVGDGGFAGAGTSAEFRALGTFDFARAGTAPLRLLLDFSYYIENGEAVYEGLPEEPDIVQEWGLQTGRYDRFMIGLGLEAPIAPYVSPYLEYRIGTPFLVELSRQGEGSREFGFDSVPHTITPGVRGFPLPELMLEVAVRIGLSDAPYTGVPATPPWMLSFGLAYTLDPRPEVIEREVKVPAPAPAPVAPPTGTVAGRVLDEQGTPIARARVDYPGRPDLTAQVVGDTGRFAGYAFAPGPVKVRATAEGRLPATVDVTVVAGKEATIDLRLKVDPAASQVGKLEVRLFDPRGKPMGGRVEVGGTEVAGDVLPDKPFSADLKPGKYTVTVRTSGFETFTQEIEVKGGQTESLRVPMKRAGAKGGLADLAPAPAPAPAAAPAEARPKGRGLAEIKGDRIVLKQPVTFAEGTDTLTADSKKVLDDVATLLRGHPEVKRVRVEAHTDDQGDREALISLSTRQAQSVKSYVAGRGVDAERLSVAGYGPDKPLAPNVTDRGRRKNRRVELRILERAR